MRHPSERQAAATRRRIVACVAVVVAASMALAGCASPADTTAPEPAPASTAAPAPATAPPAPATAAPAPASTGEPPDSTATRAAVHPIQGVALDRAGRPYAARPVVLRENRGIAADVFGTFAAVVSLGLSCVAGADPCRSTGVVQRRTGPDGSFAFSAEDVEVARDRSQGVVLAFGDLTTDGAVTVELDPAVGGEVGTIRLWEPALTATPRGAGLVLEWRGPASADGRTVLHGVITDGGPGGDDVPAQVLAFAPHGPEATVTIDRRALEDRPAALVLTAGFSRPRAGQRPRADWTAPPAGLQGAGAPLSRGAACTIDGVAAAGCPVTDGDLARAARPDPATPRPLCPPASTCPDASPVHAVVVDLGRVAAVGLIAVRNEDARLQIDTSTDGTNFVATRSGRADGNWNATLASASGRQARYIRVTREEGGYLNPAEVSVWPPSAANLATAPPAAGGSPLPAPPPAAPSPDSGAGNRWWSLLALALLLAVVIGAFAIGRRRGRTGGG